MELLLKRTYLKADCTVGCLQVILSGKYNSEVIESETRFLGTLCDTLEPRIDESIKGTQSSIDIESCAIPEGSYPLVLLDSRTHKRMMPTVLSVPRQKRIFIRAGKTPRQTKGDILIGQLMHVSGGHPSDDPHLEDSAASFRLLYRLIEEAKEHGEQTGLRVINPPS